MIEIISAYSAQPSIAKPNPFLVKAINHILDGKLLPKNIENLKVADQGCGKLRHLKVLCEYFNIIYLVDVEFQLNKMQILFGLQTSIKKYIPSLSIPGKDLQAVSALEFATSHLNLDIVFNLCVFDVEIPRTRKAMALAAFNNLKKHGLFVIVVPRNDQSILVRCTKKNIYLDGHIFHHHGIVTFYKNYFDSKLLVHNLQKQGFALETDLSVYRQICLIFRKEKE